MTNKDYDPPYKQMFSNLTFFRELLETFVPENFVKEIDFDSCQKIDKSFVSKRYENSESDLIYKVKLKNTQKEAYIYVLLEFQSSVDRFMVVRILNYITSLYLDMINASRKQDKKLLDILPPIFPIMLYNGDRNWTSKVSISELIENNSLLGEYGINFKYFKIIEKEYSKDYLLKTKNLVSNLFLFETKLEEIDEKLLDQELSKLIKKEEDKIAISILINYFKYMLIDDNINKGKFDLLEKIDFENIEANTMFSTLVKKEREKNRFEGKLEGKLEGRIESKQATLKSLLTRRFKDISEEIISKIDNCSDIDKLEKAINNIFDYTNSNDVLTFLS